MTDISVTAASVVAGSNSTIRSGTAGETVTAGQAAAINGSGQYVKADNNASAPLNSCVGVFLNGAAINQPVDVQTAGDITIGATLVKGSAYYVGDTAGGICPFADLASGEGVSLVGVARSTSELSLHVANTGAVI